MKRLAMLLGALIVAGLSLVVAVGGAPRAVANADSASRAGQAAAEAPVPKGQVRCPQGSPSDSVCKTIPAVCPPIDQPCPEVIAEPTSNLAVEQSVFITLKNFYETTDTISLQYCQDTHPLSSTWAPLCDYRGLGELPQPEVTLRPYPSGPETGSVSYAFQVLYVAKGSTPLEGQVPGTKSYGGFLCNAADPCSIDVTDPYLGPDGGPSAVTPDTENTAVIPVSFAASASGCPKAQFLNTESEYGIDTLLASTAFNSCSGSKPADAFNTDTDALAAVNSFVAGNTSVAFTDSPSDPAQQKALSAVKGKYALIPIALSANVIAFQAVAQGQEGFPDSSFELSPNMAAGIVTNEYNTSYLSDISTCSWLSGDKKCPLISELNQTPGFQAPLEYGSYPRGDTSTPVYALFQWLCSAPHVPVNVAGHEVLEPETASQVLDIAWKDNDLSKPASCPADIDSFPLFQKAVPNFGTGIAPAEQVVKLQSFVPPPSTSTQTPHAGFAPMSWPDARSFGLNDAALQNADGKFVLPTTASIEAAASEMKLGSNGIYSIDYATKNPAAYPMPDVWYALVSTSPQKKAQATEEQTLLDSILSLSGGAKVDDLPTGYAPLPASMYKKAVAEVASDITVQASTPTTTTTTTSAPVTTTTVPSAGTTGLSGSGGTSGTGPSSATTTPATTPTTSPASSHQHSPPAIERLPSELAAFALVGRSDMLLPVLLACLLGAGIVFGPGLLALARRRTRKAGDDS